MLSTVLGWLALFLSLLPQQAKSLAKPEATYRISGIVVDAVNGQPISRAEISLFLGSIEPTEISSSAVTGADGKFAFENVAPGKYTLRVQRRGYAPQAYLQHENYWTAIAVGPGMDTQKIRFPLMPSASISGQVLDEGSEPVRRAKALLFQQGVQDGRRTNRLSGQTITDDEGRFRFGHLLPGSYMVGVNAEPWYNFEAPQLEEDDGQDKFSRTYRTVSSADPVLDAIYPITFFPSSRDISGAEVIRLQAGDAETADVRLQPVPALHLHVRVPVDNETSNSHVFVTQNLGDGIELPVRVFQRVPSPGMMEISGLPSGHLNIHVLSSDGKSRKLQNESVDLSSNMEMDATRASAQWNVSGMVKMEDGSELAPNAVVQFRNLENGAAFSARVLGGGEFSIENNPISITAGAFEISIAQPAEGFVKRVKATGAKVSGARIEFEEGRDVRVEITLGRGMSSINGLALRDDKPLGGVMILLLPEDFQNNSHLIRRDQSDTDGTFTLRLVPPGRYTAVGIEGGWGLEWMNAEVLQKYLPAGTSVEVRAGEVPEVKVKVQ